ncbi:carbohydrate ABC transporter permease [Paenibacillus thalictri]|uniref:Carbohydrate ABC transporter permease n=1 Tax=Paenibacillus thalictri TaxID=2527873 RepID=A0A4Q9DKR4_9BACL|nr:carbohydrate ABC transporter permease [Paenibacillus thalictri]TBL73310.1 carbohydrate ABC transporter permease [Paenibacillus thalictri]
MENRMMLSAKIHWITCIKYALLTFHAILTIVPLLWIFSNSFRSNEEIFASGKLLPEKFDWSNYVHVFKDTNIPLAFYNSLTITLISLAGLLVCVIPCAYALSRFKFKGAHTLYMFFAMAVFIPNVTILASTFKLYQQLGLLGDRYSIAFTYISHQLPFCVFLLVSFMRVIPVALEEAAIIDGCGVWQMFYRIVLPMSQNGIVTISILSFVAIWNDYIFALIMLPNQKFRTLTVAVAYAKSEFVVDYGMMSAAIIIAVIPMILFYMIMKERLISGMVAGSVKG